MQRFYSLTLNEEKKEADLNIFGDICSFAFEEYGEYSAVTLSKQLEAIKDVKTINVHISSYGGDVIEGLAIYNTLKNHKAKIRTHCESFACSIASVIFMAGDERIMKKASLLMIHNAWTFAEGNADQLRKLADDLDKITSASITAYLEKVNIDEKTLKNLMDSETWLTPDECLEMGFATKVEDEPNSKASQSVKKNLFNMILNNQEQIKNEDEEIKPMKFECSECGYVLDGEMPEFYVCPKCGATKDKFTAVDETLNELEDEENPEDEKEQPTDEENPEVEKPEDEEEKKDDEEEATQRVIAFFNAISKI